MSSPRFEQRTVQESNAYAQRIKREMSAQRPNYHPSFTASRPEDSNIFSLVPHISTGGGRYAGSRIPGPPPLQTAEAAAAAAAAPPLSKEELQRLGGCLPGPRRPSTGSSRRSTVSTSSVAPSVTSVTASSMGRRLADLEEYIAEERRGRQAVEAQLAHLTELLERAIGGGQQQQGGNSSSKN